MKILLVAPQSEDTILGTIGVYCNDVLLNLGHGVKVFDFRQSQYLKSNLGASVKSFIKKILPVNKYPLPSIVGSLENDKMNNSLLISVKEYKPDIVFVLMGDTISASILEKIKQEGTIIVNWFLDSVAHPVRKSFVENVSRFYDYFFMIDSEEVLNYVKVSARVIKTMHIGCYPKVHKKISLSEKEKNEYGSDVSFVGTVKYKRAEVLGSLNEFNLGVWGYWADRVSWLEKCYRKQYVYGEEAVKIYNASKIVLDIHLAYGSGEKIFNVTPRIFEVPASGGFLLVDANSLLSDLYKIGEEIVCYNNENDLKEKIVYYLKHPEEREKIVLKGRQRAYSDHTYEKRFKDMFTIIKGKK